MFPVQQGAIAPSFETRAVPAVVPPNGPQLVTELPKAPAHKSYAYQASLFGPQEVIENSVRPGTPAAQRPTVRRVKRDFSAQKSLDFSAPIPEGAHTLPTSVEAAVYCDAPVAIALHRTIAAALDMAIVSIAVGVFIATVYLAGHEIVLTKETAPVYVMAATLIALFYRVIFCIANEDSLGMNWAGLRTLNFDGRRPSRRERWRRTVGACISVIASGIGFAWALVDEERLTWHDYISKTFPSPRSS
jgi:uncharacterized RDD family membrane protein YckC